MYVRQLVIFTPVFQWLNTGWEARRLLFTLTMTCCGMMPLILSPSLWIKNTLWLMPCTLWPIQSWQGRKRHVCHVEKLLVSAVEGQVAGRHFCDAFGIQTYVTIILKPFLHSLCYWRRVCCYWCLINARCFLIADGPNTDWVRVVVGNGS